MKKVKLTNGGIAVSNIEKILSNFTHKEQNEILSLVLKNKAIEMKVTYDKATEDRSLAGSNLDAIIGIVHQVESELKKYDATKS